MPRTLTVGIVYHSDYGHTARLAEAVRDGAELVEGTRTLLLEVEAAGQRWDDLAQAAAIVFGAPTFMGNVSARFKAFQDATSKAGMTKGYLWKDKVAAGFTNSGCRSGDKLATLVALALFAAQHGMHWVNLDLPPGHNSSRGSEADLNRLGFWLGVGAQSNVDEGPELAPPASDLATARHLGRRVAEVAHQLARGRAVAETRARTDTAA